MRAQLEKGETDAPSTARAGRRQLPSMVPDPEWDRKELPPIGRALVERRKTNPSHHSCLKTEAILQHNRSRLHNCPKWTPSSLLVTHLATTIDSVAYHLVTTADPVGYQILTLFIILLICIVVLSGAASLLGLAQILLWLSDPDGVTRFTGKKGVTTYRFIMDQRQKKASEIETFSNFKGYLIFPDEISLQKEKETISANTEGSAQHGTNDERPTPVLGGKQSFCIDLPC
ncbi:unnamed protein product [Haemonchus placei]|uniref:Uncharacterized protein n=1 Tax=Haemonchus placei TaxID=6290 RepID=A0A0N4WBZ2_HAEPC|nr:unnamed protein product [Haemonchus placei]